MLQQLSILVENRVGAALEVTQALEDGGFNIRAFSVYDTREFGILRMLVDETDTVSAYLTDLGFFVRQAPVIGVVLKDRPGFLNKVLRTIKDEGLQVDYMYSLVYRDQDEPLMILHTEDMEKAAEALHAAGFTVV